jgi:hypothetical protein
MENPPHNKALHLTAENVAKKLELNSSVCRVASAVLASWDAGEFGRYAALRRCIMLSSSKSNEGAELCQIYQ